MEFVLLACDVFSSEVDRHGIDLVVRSRTRQHFDVQVKSFRLKKGQTPYVFMQKAKFRIHETMLLALVKFVDGEPPTLFLVQSGMKGRPHDILESRDYGEGKKSDPEWGVTVSRKKLARLTEECAFHSIVTRLFE